MWGHQRRLRDGRAVSSGGAHRPARVILVRRAIGELVRVPRYSRHLTHTGPTGIGIDSANPEPALRGGRRGAPTGFPDARRRGTGRAPSPSRGRPSGLRAPAITVRVHPRGLRVLGLSDPVLGESTTLESSCRVTFLAASPAPRSGASKSSRAQRNSRNRPASTTHPPPSGGARLHDNPTAYLKDEPA